MADLRTELLGFVMNSPVIGASGTVGYGVEYEDLADFARIGGISGKGLTLHGQYGNKGERLWETPSGLINSIGLQNPGVRHFIDVELPEMLALKRQYGTVVIANLGGHSEEEYVEGAALLDGSAVDIVELNISCPNVKQGGMAYGVKAQAAGEVGRMVRAACRKPLMVKLSPQAGDIPAMWLRDSAAQLRVLLFQRPQPEEHRRVDHQRPQRQAGGTGRRVRAPGRRGGGAEAPRRRPQAPEGQAEPPGRGQPRHVPGGGGGRGRRHQPDQYLPGLRHRPGKAPPRL